MNAKLLCFGAASVALLGALFGCGGQLSSTPTTKQGTSEWVNPDSPVPPGGTTSVPVVPSTPQKPPAVNMQQVAEDLDLLVDPPSEKSDRPSRRIVKKKPVVTPVSAPISTPSLDVLEGTDFYFLPTGVVLKSSTLSENIVAEFSGQSCELPKNQIFDDKGVFAFQQNAVFFQFLAEKCQWDPKEFEVLQ